MSRGLGKGSGRKGVSSPSPRLRSSARADRGRRPGAGALGLVLRRRQAGATGTLPQAGAPTGRDEGRGGGSRTPISSFTCPECEEERSKRDTLRPWWRSSDRGLGPTYPIPAILAPSRRYPSCGVPSVSGTVFTGRREASGMAALQSSWPGVTFLLLAGSEGHAQGVLDAPCPAGGLGRKNLISFLRKLPEKCICTGQQPG